MSPWQLAFIILFFFPSSSYAGYYSVQYTGKSFLFSVPCHVRIFYLPTQKNSIVACNFNLKYL